MDHKRIFVAGLGHVGRALLDMLADGAGHGLTVCGLADSSGAVVLADGFSPSALSGLAEAKRNGRGLSAQALPVGARLEPDALAAIRASAPDILAELSPTDPRSGGAALAHALAAADLGASVAFASKGALVAAWDRLADAFSRGGGAFRCSATVGGGMPVLDCGRSFSMANPIDSIEAVLNGTSVYVLSLMETGLGLDEAVKKAQAAGMAEADPSADLDGLDAAAKLCIMSRFILGLPLELDSVARQGIREADPSAVASAPGRRARLRAVGRLNLAGGRAQARVSLAEVPEASALARSGSENAVIFHSRNAGDLALIGKGAGPRETATAVMRDLLRLSRAGQGL